jgi:hypothetical protein
LRPSALGIYKVMNECSTTINVLTNLIGSWWLSCRLQTIWGIPEELKYRPTFPQIEQPSVGHQRHQAAVDVLLNMMSA